MDGWNKYAGDTLYTLQYTIDPTHRLTTLEYECTGKRAREKLREFEDARCQRRVKAKIYNLQPRQPRLKTY